MSSRAFFLELPLLVLDGLIHMGWEGQKERGRPVDLRGQGGLSAVCVWRLRVVNEGVLHLTERGQY